jgi:hypothetical protein
VKNLRGWRFPSPVLLLILLAIPVFVSCWPREFVPSGPIVHSHDSWVKDGSKGGPEIDVSGFKWRYLNPTDQIKLWGETINNGPTPVQSVRIIIDAFDQFNFHLGTSETYLNPTYIQPGGTGKFEFYIPRGEWVEHIRLRYRIESRVE